MLACKRSAASGQAERRHVLADRQIIAHGGSMLGVVAIGIGWLLAFATIATLHVVSATATFELASFASLLFGFGAGWCARGGRHGRG